MYSYILKLLDYFYETNNRKLLRNIQFYNFYKAIKSLKRIKIETYKFFNKIKKFHK